MSTTVNAGNSAPFFVAVIAASAIVIAIISGAISHAGIAHSGEITPSRMQAAASSTSIGIHPDGGLEWG